MFELWNDYRARFLDAGLTLDVEHHVDEVWIEGDEQRVAQVISNLLTNSMKFTPRGGRVALILDADDSEKMSVVRVRDTGVGISIDMLPRLFEAFVQADYSLDRSQSGLGLGLAIAKAVVDMHGGRIEADSAGLGKGSEFVIRVPFVQAERTTKPQSISSRPPPPRRVLIIEDNEDAADCLREALELSDHKVDVAYDGREGLVKAREFNPDVVLCDIGLSGMSGFDVARAFRSDHVLSSIYLVAITGSTQTQDRERAERAGFNFHLPKPLRMEDIQELFVNLAKRMDGKQPR